MSCRILALFLVLLLADIGPIVSAEAPPQARLPIAVDVGHSQARWGATSARGVNEYVFNAELARAVVAALQTQGLQGAFLLDSGKKRRAPGQRTRLAAAEQAGLLLSIHHDSVQPHYLQPWTHEGRTLRYSNRFQGYSLFYSEKNPKARASLELAREIGAALRLAGFTPSPHHAEPIAGENRDFVDPQRGVYRFDDLLVLKTAAMPAVLLEAGIIVNSIEERALRNPVRQQRMARAVALGVARHLGAAPRPETTLFDVPEIP